MCHITNSRECTVYGDHGTVLRYDRRARVVTFSNLTPDSAEYKEMLRRATDACA